MYFLIPLSSSTGGFLFLGLRFGAPPTPDSAPPCCSPSPSPGAPVSCVAKCNPALVLDVPGVQVAVEVGAAEGPGLPLRVSSKKGSFKQYSMV